MKRPAYVLAILFIVSGLSACQKKQYTCQCTVGFAAQQYNYPLKARNKRNANSACLYFNNDGATDLEPVYDCHLID